MDLGDINSLLVGFYGDDNTKWTVGKVYVKLDDQIEVFVCGRALGKSEPDKRTEVVIYRDDDASVDVAESVFEPLPTTNSAKSVSEKPNDSNTTKAEPPKNKKPIAKNVKNPKEQAAKSIKAEPVKPTPKKAAVTANINGKGRAKPKAKGNNLVLM